MPFVDGPDCSLWVEQAGGGEPVTIFAHGVTGSIDELRPLSTATPGTRILLDFRGHGRSETPDETAAYDHAAMARDLRAVADLFGASQALGISMGAGALMQIMAEQPARFSRICLFLVASIDGANEGANAHYPPLADLLERYPLDEVAERTVHAPEQQPLFERRPYWKTLVRERIMRMNSTGVPRALRAYVAGPPPLRDAEVLRAVTAPVLLLAHEGDPVHDAAHARRLAEIVPDARLEIWPEPLAMFDDVAETAALIGAFFSA